MKIYIFIKLASHATNLLQYVLESGEGETQHYRALQNFIVNMLKWMMFAFVVGASSGYDRLL